VAAAARLPVGGGLREGAHVARDPFGAGFEKALDLELGKTILQSSVGREIQREHERRPPQEPAFKLRGAPGSPERLQQVIEHVQDPSLIGELAWSSVGTFLENSLHQVRAWEESRDYEDWEQPPPEVVEAFTSAARMIAQTGDPQLYAAYQNELEQIGSELSEYLPNAVQYAAQEGALEGYELERAQVQAQIDARHEMLQREYGDIEKRTGPAGIEAADKFIRGLGDTAYSPAMDEDAMRAAARATAEAAAATERGWA
jgi:hypothetical protein